MKDPKAPRRDPQERFTQASQPGSGYGMRHKPRPFEREPATIASRRAKSHAKAHVRP